MVIREWQIWGLPVDDYSTENGILATRGKRWPLMIDPQNAGQRLGQGMEAERDQGDQGQRPDDPAHARERHPRSGTPVLLEDVGEELDPALEPVLQKQVYKQGGRTAHSHRRLGRRLQRGLQVLPHDQDA